MKGKTALLSVFDKTGIADFAAELENMDYRILSTGGTAKELTSKGVKVEDISSFTGYPELFSGRVKTLHPLVHGGILAREQDLPEVREHDLELIDLVVVNLYPFQEVAKKTSSTDSDLLEMIDVGGPTLLRASAKNFPRVLAVVDPDDYDEVISRIREDRNDFDFRRKMAVKAFAHTSEYDVNIFNTLSSRWEDGSLPMRFGFTYKKDRELRYGENPHQRGGLYISDDAADSSLSKAKKLHGKLLSYNNYLDADNALAIVRDFEKPCACVVKHINPCGVGTGDDIGTAWKRAYGADKLSAFGGIVAFNREVDEEIADSMRKIFLEVIIAPSYTDGAMDILKKKKNRRIIQTGPLEKPRKSLEFRSIDGGLLVQDNDCMTVTEKDLKTVTERKPTEAEVRSMLFGFNLLKHIKSNTVIYTNEYQTVGIGAGQTSRVDAARIAGRKSKGRSQGCAMASDAFFPFRDGIDTAAEFGITSVIQPGGSIRDDEVIEAANEHGMAMVFTGKRAFWH